MATISTVRSKIYVIMSRVQILSRKLLHESHSVRLRATTNLIFKVKSDLLSDAPECALDILQNLNSALVLVKSDTAESREFVSLLINLAIDIVQQYSGRVFLDELIATTVAQTNRLFNEGLIGSNLLEKLNEVYMKILINHRMIIYVGIGCIVVPFQP